MFISSCSLWSIVKESWCRQEQMKQRPWGNTACSPWLPHLVFYITQEHLPGSVTARNGLCSSTSVTHQEDNVPWICPSVWQRHLLSWGFLFSDISVSSRQTLPSTLTLLPFYLLPNTFDWCMLGGRQFQVQVLHRSCTLSELCWQSLNTINIWRISASLCMSLVCVYSGKFRLD